MHVVLHKSLQYFEYIWLLIAIKPIEPEVTGSVEQEETNLLILMNKN